LQAIERTLENPLVDKSYREDQTKILSPVMRALRSDIQGGEADVIIMRIKELDHLSQGLAQHILSRSIQVAHRPVESAGI